MSILLERASYCTESLFTASQVRDIDKQVIAAGTPGIALMRQAAEAAWSAVELRFPASKKIVVCCGAGNNGGDGYLFARAALARGRQVQVIALSQPRGDAALACDQLLADGVSVHQLADNAAALSELGAALQGAQLIVDALLGTGASGPPRAIYAKAITAINNAAKPCLALDIPSGICADSGKLLGDQAVRAGLTVSFIALKRGLFTDSASEHVGELVFAPLASDVRSYYPQPAASLCDIAALFQQLPKRGTNHYKNRSGHVLVVGGDRGMAGAVILAGSAALRAGAGLVSVATRPEHVSAVVAAQPELMVHGIEKTATLDGLLQRADVVVVGPGLGQSAWSQQLMQRVANSHSVAVVDADAINLIAANQALMPKGEALFTPHPGEAKRLARSLSIDDNLDRFALAEALQRGCKKTVILKGAGTIIAETHQTRLSCYGHPVLATAGSGDVLSGLSAAFIAQGMGVGEAAAFAVCVHAQAGEHWAEMHGCFGMLASDIIDASLVVVNQLDKKP